MKRILLLLFLLLIPIVSATTGVIYPVNNTEYSFGTGGYNNTVTINTSYTSYCFLNDTNYVIDDYTNNTIHSYTATDRDNNLSYSISYACTDNVTEFEPTIALDLHSTNDGTFTNYDFNHGEKKNGVDCSNGYCEFNGVNQYLDLPAIGTNNYTISMWIKINKQNTQYVLDDQTGLGGYILLLNTGVISSVSGQTRYVNGVTGTTLTNIDEWYYLVITGLQLKNTPFRLSARDTGANYFNGSIQNLQIYQGDLTPTEILNNFNAGRNSAPLVSDGLVLYMPMSVNTQNTTHVYDTNNYVLGSDNVSESARFDGVDDYINIPRFSANNKTLCINVKSTGFLNYPHLFSDTITTQDYIRFNNNGLFLTIETNTNGDFAQLDYAFNSNEWYNICLIQNNLNWSLYVDGNFEDSDTVTNPNLYIQNIGFGRYLNGTIDKVLIFNRSLSQTEITEVYNGWDYNPYDDLATGLVLNMPLNTEDIFHDFGTGTESSSFTFSINNTCLFPITKTYTGVDLVCDTIKLVGPVISFENSTVTSSSAPTVRGSALAWRNSILTY